MIEPASISDLLVQCLDPRPGERAVIISNPVAELRETVLALRLALEGLGVEVQVVEQEVKSLLEPMEPQVLHALGQAPELILCPCWGKIGLDPLGQERPYRAGGRSFNHILFHLIFGRLTSRGFWSPGFRPEDLMLCLTVDWSLLRKRAATLRDLLSQARSCTIRGPNGTHLRFTCEGRKPMVDDGDFRQSGRGGNLPSGEVYLSPRVGSAQGRLVIDGSMAFASGSHRLDSPLVLDFVDGFLTHLEGEEAERLRQDLEAAAAKSPSPHEAANCWHLGEFGLGLLPLRELTGRVLVDEKALGTCHLAVGANYDGDAPAPIHLDGVLLHPTVEVELVGGRTQRLLEDGLPVWDALG